MSDNPFAEAATRPAPTLAELAAARDAAREAVRLAMGAEFRAGRRFGHDYPNPVFDTAVAAMKEADDAWSRAKQAVDPDAADAASVLPPRKGAAVNVQGPKGVRRLSKVLRDWWVQLTGRKRNYTRPLPRSQEDSPTLEPGTIVCDGEGLPEMVLIPEGRFTMGVPESESQRLGVDEDRSRPLHEVTIPRPFFLGKYPVTRGQYAAFVDDTRYRKDRGSWRDVPTQTSDEYPVINVSDDDAQAYAAWLSRKTGQVYRLPSEAEWEYAARAGTTTARYWGDGFESAARYAWIRNNAEATAPVGGNRFPNKFGLYDMLGNVNEWVQDCRNSTYIGAPNDGTAWTTGECNRRIIRGGSWIDYPRAVRSGYRDYRVSGTRTNTLGFRLARVYTVRNVPP